MSTLKVDAIRHNSATSDAITTAADGTCTARITGMTGGGGLSNRNIFINGAMTVAQRGVSSTTHGYGSVDRYYVGYNAVQEAPTQAQADISAGTTPYTLGFRKSLNIPENAVVFGRYGGYDQFDYPWVKDTIKTIVEQHSNIYFLFLNTAKFIDHPKVLFCGGTDSIDK